MGILNEFRDFIVRGNAIDLAVGIIIGAAFGGVVNSLVADIIMPPIGLVLGGVDFSRLAIVLRDKIPVGADHPLIPGLKLDAEIPAVVIGYGKFINALIALLIQGAAIFLVVRAINRFRTAPAAPVPAGPPEDVLLLREIRDALRK